MNTDALRSLDALQAKKQPYLPPAVPLPRPHAHHHAPRALKSRPMRADHPACAMSVAAWSKEPTTLDVLFTLQLPYRPPRSVLGAFLWKRRVWFETTFALSMCQPWEKVVLLLVIHTALLLLTLAVYAYLPAHLSYLHARASYYVFGDEPASAAAVLPAASGWLASVRDNLSAWNVRGEL